MLLSASQKYVLANEWLMLVLDCFPASETPKSGYWNIHSATDVLFQCSPCKFSHWHKCHELGACFQEDFSEVMKGYLESFKAMDLVAEHRLRALRNSAAWQQKQQDSSPLMHLGSKIEHMLQAINLSLKTFLISELVHAGGEGSHTYLPQQGCHERDLPQAVAVI